MVAGHAVQSHSGGATEVVLATTLLGKCPLGYNDFDFFWKNFKSGPMDGCENEFLGINAEFDADFESLEKYAKKFIWKSK